MAESFRAYVTLKQEFTSMNSFVTFNTIFSSCSRIPRKMPVVFGRPCHQAHKFRGPKQYMRPVAQVYDYSGIESGFQFDYYVYRGSNPSWLFSRHPHLVRLFSVFWLFFLTLDFDVFFPFFGYFSRDYRFSIHRLTILWRLFIPLHFSVDENEANFATQFFGKRTNWLFTSQSPQTKPQI